MPDFSSNPIYSEEELNKWLNFYEMSAPLVALGTLMSSDIPVIRKYFYSYIFNKLNFN